MRRAGPGGATPFASSQVDMGTNVAPSEANSTRVVGIVLALFFSTGVGFVIISFILIFGFFTLRQKDGLASNDKPKGPDHVRDSGIIHDPDLKGVVQRQNARRRAAKNAEVKDPMAEMFGGLGAAPVTVYVSGPGKEQYHGIEILCDMANFRQRAPIVKKRAYLPIVPAARCRLVFQGNVPVKSWVTGGDTVNCTFNPIVCR